MTDEEKQAIKYFNECITKDRIYEEDLTLSFMGTILNLIEKKNTTIKRMAATMSTIMKNSKNSEIVKRRLENGYCEFINSEEEHCWKKTFKNCKDCIIEYFEKKEEV